MAWILLLYVCIHIYIYIQLASINRCMHWISIDDQSIDVCFEYWCTIHMKYKLHQSLDLQRITPKHDLQCVCIYACMQTTGQKPSHRFNLNDWFEWSIFWPAIWMRFFSVGQRYKKYMRDKVSICHYMILCACLNFQKFSFESQKRAKSTWYKVWLHDNAGEFKCLNVSLSAGPKAGR